jgi:putative methionine-R-sulfoxide reductase with GAF domain
LIVGPFQGKPACVRIPLSKGVCGAAATTQQTQVTMLVTPLTIKFVQDVHEFPGHIACDGASNSEIVVPVIVDGKVVAVFDLDNKEINGWEEEDKTGLEALVRLLEESLNWDQI